MEIEPVPGLGVMAGASPNELLVFAMCNMPSGVPGSDETNEGVTASTGVNAELGVPTRATDGVAAEVETAPGLGVMASCERISGRHPEGVLGVSSAVCAPSSTHSGA